MPTVEFPPVIPLTFHVTAVLAVFLTVAVKVLAAVSESPELKPEGGAIAAVGAAAT